MSLIFYYFLIFQSRHVQDRQADLHQIYQEDDKWATIEKLSLWFVNSFRRGSKVQKNYFRFGPIVTKCNMATNWIYLSKNESCLITTGKCLYQTLKSALKSVKRRPRSFANVINF